MGDIPPCPSEGLRCLSLLAALVMLQLDVFALSEGDEKAGHGSVPPVQSSRPHPMCAKYFVNRCRHVLLVGHRLALLHGCSRSQELRLALSGGLVTTVAY